MIPRDDEKDTALQALRNAYPTEPGSPIIHWETAWHMLRGVKPFEEDTAANCDYVRQYWPYVEAEAPAAPQEPPPQENPPTT